MRCRSCDSDDLSSLVDFGNMPLANAYRVPDDDSPEAVYPLHAYTCADCGLVQVDHTIPPSALFADYAFFSSYSRPWVQHCRDYVQSVTGRFNLTSNSQIVEIASNDGCLLAQFRGAQSDPLLLGVDPAENVAKVAVDHGVATITEFFTESLARTLPPADLLIANNVLGHVPDLHDFVAGAWTALAREGVWTIEVPHLLQLLNCCEYDTIYHEHFSYFSLMTLVDLLHEHNLRVFDVDEMPIHGGSIRLYVCHHFARHHNSAKVERLLEREQAEGLDNPATSIFSTFAPRVAKNSAALRDWLNCTRGVVGVGAPAKASTLLNVAGVTPAQLPFTTDTSPHKQGLLMPGSRIPIEHPDMIDVLPRPEALLVLAWNWADEIRRNFPTHRLAIPIPEMRVE